jgi:hypothetical protein
LTQYQGSKGHSATSDGLVIIHGLLALFLEVIMLAIILLLVGRFVLVVLVFATRVIMAQIVLMMIVRLLVFAIVLVALMVVAILATILLVAQITAACNRKMSRLLHLGLFLLLDLLKDASCFIRSLTLLEKGNELKQVSGHHLVHLCKFVLMCLGLQKEDCLLFSCTMGNSII